MVKKWVSHYVLKIPGNLHTDLKHKAIDSGLTLHDLIIKILDEYAEQIHKDSKKTGK